MSIAHEPDRFTTLPDDEALAATVVALEEHGFSVELETISKRPGMLFSPEFRKARP